MAVAKDQAGDLLRRRYLQVLLIVGVAVILLFIGYLVFMKEMLERTLSSPPPGQQYSAEETRAMMELGMNAVQGSLHALVAFMGTVLALALMCYSVRGEISRGTIRMVLSRPIRRYEYVIGKWLGCAFTVLVYYVLMGVLVTGYTYYTAGRLLSFVPVSLAMGFLKAVMVGSVGMALSIVLHPLLSLTIAYFCAAETFLFISRFLSGTAEQIVKIPFYILPSYKALDTYGAIITGVTISAGEIAYRSAYALLLSVLMVTIAARLFRKRDLI
jgi:ABC-type transport system involved in multi-copper enzyme maturation permease subunit